MTTVVWALVAILASCAIFAVVGCAPMTTEVSVPVQGNATLVLQIDGMLALRARNGDNEMRTFTVEVPVGWHVFSGDYDFDGIGTFAFREEVLCRDHAMAWAPYVVSRGGGVPK